MAARCRRGIDLHSILGAIAVCAFVFLYALFTRPQALGSLQGLAIYLLLAAALSGALLLVRSLAWERRQRILLLLLSTATALYGAEIVLTIAARVSAPPAECDHTGPRGLLAVKTANCADAHHAGQRFDSRSTLEMLREYERRGTLVWPLVTRRSMRSNRFSIDGYESVILGGISEAATIHCNEAGFFVVYRSDEHGFRNPPGLHEPPLSVGLVGDSFAHGHCVRPGEDMASIIRERYPRTLNVGFDGNGPLRELATIREYLAPLAPRVVIWFFYGENDAYELERERQAAALLAYLGEDSGPSIREHQELVDSTLMEVVRSQRLEAEAAAESSVDSRNGFRLTVAGIFAFEETRKRIVSLVRAATNPEAMFLDTELFSAVMETARDAVAEWGGELYFVYLPSAREMRMERRHAVGDSALAVAIRAKIPTVDGYAVLSAQADPLSFFPFRRGHYNARGYRLMADAVVAAMKHSLEAGTRFLQ